MIRLAQGLKSFRRDQTGLAAVEFALLAPLMILFYFGMAELCQGYMAQKRMSHVTSMIADLTAQAQSVNQNDLNDIFNIGNEIMQPFSPTPLQVRVSSVTRGADGVVDVDWSFGRNMDDLEEPVTVPAGLIGNGESLIVAEAIYDYQSPVDQFLPGVTKLSRIFYLRPRVVDKVLCSNC
jgi:Flp pilus assembly protein TadG